MKKTPYAKIASVINQVVEFAKQQLSDNRETDLFCRFVKLFYGHVSYRDIRQRPVAELYSIAHSQWQLIKSRKPNELTLRVFNPSFENDGWQSTHTIIQMVINDMPFVIDSTRIEMERLGLTSHFMLHMGGMKVIRDEDNHLVNLATYHSRSEGVVEAPIYIEVDRQTDVEKINKIKEGLTHVVEDVRLAVQDWPIMQEKMREAIAWLQQDYENIDRNLICESKAFLEWLLADHFTFLGARDYKVVGLGEQRALKLIPESGLGVLRDCERSQTYRHFSALPEQARALALSKDRVLIISKTNTRSTVHRSTYTDYIGVKRFDQHGELIGERRFIGLFTSSAYNESPTSIPVLRDKVRSVIEASGLPVRSHDGKDLMHILATLPRDDLFQCSDEELFEVASGILHLQERRRIRLFVRRDPYQRFISCLVYVPRENFNADLLLSMTEILINAFNGIEVSYETQFSASVLARIHFVVRINPKEKLEYDVEQIEKQLIEVGKSWIDGFREGALDYYGEERGNYLINKYRRAFSAGYREVFLPRSAVYDIEFMEKLDSENELGMSLFKSVGDPANAVRFKLYHLTDTVPLSDAIPILENMGLRVIGEQPYQIKFEDEAEVWINDFTMTYQSADAHFNVQEVKEIFQGTFYAVWRGDAENDPLNRLVLEAQMNCREIAMLRAYAKYLRQVRSTFSLEYIAETMVKNSLCTRLLVDIFKNRFDPSMQVEAADNLLALEENFIAQLDQVQSLDEDRIFRRFLELIKATLRTNYFQRTVSGGTKSYLSFKFDPQKISKIPLPRPKYEIYVYSPRFEGVHLRMAKVARGGIRWSDRREDFRTEVLGLMKAQQVKNAVIVPSGAKGGFFPKMLPADGDRDAILEEARHCYRTFISGLLDLTDNLHLGEVVQPIDTVCYDDQDTYLVVAADKGTATFSDIANQIAINRGFWLGDAFASGGSTGYDHKKMGITARGAWVSAERHFQELSVNVDNAEITVVGIGDMSGDVFGNGMLISNHTKLIAAFNHMHIFLDPNPDPKKSFDERMRLYNLPRSTWDDYNRALISQGGGVFRRNVKSIRLSPEIKEALDIASDVLEPNQLIQEILRSPVDLIWNGGIGTYIKSSQESHAEVGDHANDVLRINGREVRARVICEGGNLGITQLGRVECELAGCKLNTDFIDNSAGVDCSDHEVNIKILLNAAMAASEINEQQRNSLLSRMTDEVANLVLQNNYHQNQALSLAHYTVPRCMQIYKRYMFALQQEGRIDLQLENLPDEATLLQRKADNVGLTRPELAILFAYTKIIIESQVRESDLTEDAYLAEFVKDAFPTPLRSHYQQQLITHHLYREIISTQISNQVVSDMGITFVYQMQDETGASVPAIVRAYAAAREIYHMPELYADIEALDYKVDATIQLQMMETVICLVRRATRWLLRNRRLKINISETIREFIEPIQGLFERLPTLLLGNDKRTYDAERDELIAANVPPDVAVKMAILQPMFQTLNIIELARQYSIDAYQVAEIYFILLERLELSWFRQQINAFPADNRWTALAKSALKGDLDSIQRTLVAGIINAEDAFAENIAQAIDVWFAQHQALIERWERVVASLRSTETKEFALLSVAIRELLDLAQTSVDYVKELT